MNEEYTLKLTKEEFELIDSALISVSGEVVDRIADKMLIEECRIVNKN